RALFAPEPGSFDTPVNNTTGIAGSIAVTGWALDPIEVTKVDIWREPSLARGAVQRIGLHRRYGVCRRVAAGRGRRFSQSAAELPRRLGLSDAVYGIAQQWRLSGARQRNLQASRHRP